MSPPRRTVVKVCGLTRVEDARHALACGADWLGFVVGAGGPRDIGAERMAAIVAELPGATAVAVVAGVDAPEALRLARRSGATRLQLHRARVAGWPDDFPMPCAFVTSVGPEGDARGEIAPPPHLVLLDAAHPTLTGGTGRTFPWARARALCGDRPFMLAGGLDGTNVAEAMRAARPFGVDASSRLESAPGVKDPERVRSFVAAVRESDERFHA